MQKHVYMYSPADTSTFTHTTHICTRGRNPCTFASPTDSPTVTQRHTHVCTYGPTDVRTRVDSYTRPEASRLQCSPGFLERGQDSVPQTPGASASFRPSIPSTSQMFAAPAPASQPDVLNAPGCLRDLRAKGVTRLPPDVSMTPHSAPGREEPEAPQGSQSLLRLEKQAGGVGLSFMLQVGDLKV